MRITQLVRRITPRDDRFHDVLDAQASLLTEASRAVLAVAAAGAPHDEGLRRLLGLEHESAVLAQRMELLLATTFATPLDRADVRAISAGLHDLGGVVGESVTRATAHARAFDDDALAPQLHRLGALVALVGAQGAHVRPMRPRAIVELRREMKTTERAARAAHHAARAAAFADTRAPAEALRRQAAHEAIAGAIEAASAVGRLLGAVALKHA
jgi:hypothetical protein